VDRFVIITACVHIIIIIISSINTQRGEHTNDRDDSIGRSVGKASRGDHKHGCSVLRNGCRCMGVRLCNLPMERIQS